MSIFRGPSFRSAPCAPAPVLEEPDTFLPERLHPEAAN